MSTPGPRPSDLPRPSDRPRPADPPRTSDPEGPDQSELPGVASVREVLAALATDGATDGATESATSREPDHDAGSAPVAADGAGAEQPADRLARLEAAHRRLRTLLELPDA